MFCVHASVHLRLVARWHAPLSLWARIASSPCGKDVIFARARLCLLLYVVGARTRFFLLGSYVHWLAMDFWLELPSFRV